MKTGLVKFYSVSKGYGFIKDDSSDKEFFVHATHLLTQIKEGYKVTFEIFEGKNGAHAINVKKIIE
jgi:CspA family cold shock protein